MLAHSGQSTHAIRRGGALRWLFAVRCVGLLTGLLTVAPLLPACKRTSPATKAAQTADNALAASVSPGKSLPTYRFRDESLKQAHPAVTAFVTQFLETCLTGDYLAYRRLVSRFEKPESKERFTAIYQGLSGIVVESIERVDPQRLARLSRGSGRLVVAEPQEPAGASPAAASSTSSAPDGVANATSTNAEVYLVISTVTFESDAKVKLRNRSRKVAILAFQEDDGWRMAPAPAELQPREQPARERDEASQLNAEPIPEYPWEQDGDS